MGFKRKKTGFAHLKHVFVMGFHFSFIIIIFKLHAWPLLHKLQDAVKYLLSVKPKAVDICETQSRRGKTAVSS